MEPLTIPAPRRAPRPLMLACLLGFAWLLYTVGGFLALRLLDVEEAGLLANFQGISIGPTIFQGFCLAAIWNMQRWGVLAYGVIALVHQVLYIVRGDWAWWWLIAPLVVVGAGAFYYRRMPPSAGRAAQP